MLPKLHLIAGRDELRPAICHIQITREDLRVTNTHALAIVPTKAAGLNPEELPEEPIYLHWQSYKDLTVAGISRILYADGQFRLFMKNKPDKLVPVSEMDERFPDFEPILPHWNDVVPLESICFNPKLLADLAEAISLPGDETKNVKLGLFAQNRIILVKPIDSHEGTRACIMPVMNKKG